jgi:hypothetical protein
MLGEKLDALVAQIELDNSQVKTSLNEVKSEMGKLKGSSEISGGAMAGAFMKAQIALEALKAAVNLAGRAISSVVGYFDNASQAALDYDKALTTLGIVSERLGVSQDKAKEAATLLAKELKIGVGTAAEGLQNLFQSGLGLEEATELMKRFTNEAMTGKASTISLDQAVNNLAFAYKTESSALGNMSGISENFTNIIEMGAKAMGKQVSQLTEAEKAQAKYRGMIELTNLTLGSSEKITVGLMGAQIAYSQTQQNVLVAIGQKFNEAFGPMRAAMLTTMGNAMLYMSDLSAQFFEGFKSKSPEMNASLQSLSDSLLGLATALGFTGDNMEGVAFSMGDSFANAIIRLSEFLNTITQQFTVLKGVLDEIRKNKTIISITEFIETMGDAMGKFLDGFGKGFKDYWFMVVNMYNEYLKPALERLWNKLSELFGLGNKDGKDFGKTLEKIGEVLGVALVISINAIVGAITIVVNAMIWWIDVFTAAQNKIDEFVDNAKKAFSGLKDFLTSIANGVGGIIKGMFNSFITSFNLFIKGLNTTIDLANKVPGVDISHLSKIDYLAQGTDNWKGGMAIVGEKGPELVSMPKGSQVFNNTETKNMMGGVTINNYIDKSVDIDAFQNRLNLMLRYM